MVYSLQLYDSMTPNELHLGLPNQYCEFPGDYGIVGENGRAWRGTSAEQNPIEFTLQTSHFFQEDIFPVVNCNSGRSPGPLEADNPRL